MKILYLITKSNWGGAQKYVYDLSTYMKSKHHDVVVAFGGRGELSHALEEAGIRTWRMQDLVRDIALSKEWKSFLEIVSILRREKPDIFHVNSSKAGGLGAFAGRLLGVKKIIYTVHGAPFREDRSKLVRAVLYILTYITCLFSHVIITVSRRDEHDIGSMPFMKKKTIMIYNGIPVTGETKSASIKTKTTRIVTIGDLTRNKGYMFSLEAIRMLVKDGYDVTYTIEGEGEDRKKIEEYIAYHNLGDVVSLLGRTLKTSGRLHEFDVFLLPSVKEGLPYVLLESGKAMMPTVTTITGGIPEIVRHEETGLLVQTKNAQAIKESIVRFIKDKKFAKEMGQNLHAHVVQHFSHTKMLVETMKAYGIVGADKNNHK